MKKFTLLVVDDQANWRDLLVEMLKEKEAFNIMCAGSYDEALKLIRRQQPPFHVIITDLRLRDDEQSNEEGLRLIDELSRSGSQTNSIVITGYPTVGSARRAFAQFQAYDYFEKHPSDGSPFDVAAFQSCVLRAAEDAERKRPRSLHLVVEISSQEQGATFPYSRVADLQLGKTYHLKLSLHDTPSVSSWPVLFNQTEKLTVFLFAEHMEVLPGVEWIWDVTETNNARQTAVTIVPRQAGEKKLMLEIQQNSHPLVRIPCKTNVS